MTVAIQSESEVVRMSVLPKSKERRSLLSALETIQLILSFGMFTIALIKLIVELLKNEKKNNRSLTLAS
ncbi:putative holin-like toxin [Enterococcus faecalis]|nr:putative holin-like toxin [Enterococcus faecalis]